MRAKKKLSEMDDPKSSKRDWVEYNEINTVFLKNGESFMTINDSDTNDELQDAFTKKRLIPAVCLTMVRRVVDESEEMLKVHYAKSDAAMVWINPDEIERVEAGDAILERTTFSQPYILDRYAKSWKYEEN